MRIIRSHRLETYTARLSRDRIHSRKDALMGGTSKQTQDVSQTQTQAPYGPAIPLVSGVAQCGDWAIAKSVATYAGTAASVCGTYC